MQRVTGIGGVFIKANDAESLRAWHQTRLGIDVQAEESELSRFGWVIDPEGNKVELWEPPAGASTRHPDL
jgi:hypothetical protein